MAKTKFRQNELTKKWIESYKHLNQARGLSQLQLQKDIGMNQSFISQILNNRVNFPAKYLVKYCKAYRINITSLNGNEEFRISGNSLIRKAPVLKRNASNGTNNIYSVDKALESIKHALSNGFNADIPKAIKIINVIGSKIASLQEDISDLERALGMNRNGTRGKKQENKASIERCAERRLKVDIFAH